MEKDIIKITKNTNVLDALTEYGFSYNYACKMLRNKDVRLFDEKIKENFPLSSGDELTIFFSADSLRQSAKFEIIYQDDFVIIADKDTGIESEELAKKLSAFAVHRLDRNTTGLNVFAKNKIAQDSLLDAFKNHKVEKIYLAEVVGKTEFKNFTHKAYLLKDAQKSLVKIFDKKVKGSVEISTIFNTISSNPSSSIVECKLISGKTHQIRASLAYLGHPIIGDGKYGKNEDNKKFKAKYQKLHSNKLSFTNLSSPLQYLNNKSFKSKPKWIR